jgi:hypothetical protein
MWPFRTFEVTFITDRVKVCGVYQVQTRANSHVLTVFGEVCVKFLKPVRTARDEGVRNKNFEREVSLMRYARARGVCCGVDGV